MHEEITITAKAIKTLETSTINVSCDKCDMQMVDIDCLSSS